MPSFNDLALDTNPLSTTFGDIYLVNGDLATVSGAAAILQNILQTLGVFAGEWFLNVNQGVDYLGKILIKNPNQRIIDAILISQILSVPGVTALTSYSFKADFVTRTLSVRFSAQTTQGIVDYSGTLPTGTAATGATT